MEEIGFENEGNMEYTRPLDYTGATTHTERIYTNTTELELNKKANEVVDKKFLIDNLKSWIPLRNGLPVSSSTPEADYKAARDTEYNLRRYSGIATRSQELDESASKIHSRLLKPKSPQVIPPTTNNTYDIEDREIKAREELMTNITRVPPISSTIIRNNPAVSKGMVQNKSYNNSMSIVVGGINSNPFGKISNESSFDRTTSRTARTSTISNPVEDTRSVKIDRSFAAISNTSNSVPFGTIHNNKNSIQKTTDLGLKFSKFTTDYYMVPRY